MNSFKMFKNMPQMIPRVECGYCGWYNNKPSKANKDKSKCSRCGKNLKTKLQIFKDKLNQAIIRQLIIDE